MKINIQSFNYIYPQKKNFTFKQTEMTSNSSLQQNTKLTSYSSENVKANYIPSFKSFLRDMKAEEFNELLDTVQVNGEPLRNQITDTSFFKDKDFNAFQWVEFINLFNQDDDKKGKTYLERFLNKNTLQELIDSPEFEPFDVLYMIKQMIFLLHLNKDEGTYDLLEILCDVENSKYDAIERLNAMQYFFASNTQKGASIFQSDSQRISRLNILKFLMNIDPGSVEASNTEMLLNLVKEGVVDNNIFGFLPQNGKLSPLIIEDIEKLYNAYINGINPIDAFIPTFETQEEAEKALKVGDVFAIKNKRNCRIITHSWGHSMPLHMNKKTYFELFPPIKRFSSTQSNIGNCWEISVLKALYATPESRYTVLRLFKQSGKDIKIKFQDGYSKEITFKNGELPEFDENEASDVFSNGAKGFQLIEYADGKELQAQKIRRYNLHLKDIARKDKELAQQKREELARLLEKGDEALTIEYDYKKSDWKVKAFNGKNKFYCQSPSTQNRDGGSCFDFMYRLGYKGTDEVDTDDKDEIQNVLIDDFEYKIIFWTTKKKVKETQTIYPNHTYFISSANYDKDGNIIDYNVVNPWGAVEQRLTLDELKKNGTFVHTKKYQWC